MDDVSQGGMGVELNCDFIEAPALSLPEGTMALGVIGVDHTHRHNRYDLHYDTNKTDFVPYLFVVSFSIGTVEDGYGHG